MKYEQASELMLHYKNALREISAMLPIVDRLDADERKEFIGAIAETLTAMLFISNPILMEHPELDVDGSVHRPPRKKPQ